MEVNVRLPKVWACIKGMVIQRLSLLYSPPRNLLLRPVRVAHVDKSPRDLRNSLIVKIITLHHHRCHKEEVGRFWGLESNLLTIMKNHVLNEVIEFIVYS